MPATTLKFPDDIDSHEQFMHFRISKKLLILLNSDPEKRGGAVI